MDKVSWGKLPAQVQQELIKKEWHNRRVLKQHLLGQREFPIQVTLHAPKNDMQALSHLDHFKQFVHAWRNVSDTEQVVWREKKKPCLTQSMPTHLCIDNFQQLLTWLGKQAEQQYQHWQQLMQIVLDVHINLKPVLVQHLSVLQKYTVQDLQKLKNLLSCLHANMAENKYIRELVIEGVDTKFIENNQKILADLLDVLHHGAVSEQGGLLKWLNCLDLPKGWLLLRYLDPEHRGVEILKIASNTLMDLAITAKNILIIENEQSCYALPKLADCVAIAGAGKNLTWLTADWLNSKNIAYWGDIDSWGLSFLSDARAHLPNLTALMMNQNTVEMHHAAMVNEPSSVLKLPIALTEAEQNLFYALKNRDFEANRLEQERLNSDYIYAQIQAWLSQE